MESRALDLFDLANAAATFVRGLTKQIASEPPALAVSAGAGVLPKLSSCLEDALAVPKSS